jgi:tRNA G18 (ribose-2'-O)-methylase SpoU
MELVAILHNIRSIHNVGSIFRTADGAGVRKLYLCGITPAPFDRFKNIRPDFAKVALGAEKLVAWAAEKDTAATIAALKKDGYEIFALEQSPRSVPYYKAFDDQVSHGGDAVRGGGKKIALVLGAEVDGIPDDLLALADRVIEIPMHGGKESLNVSVAFGIAAFGLRYSGRLGYNESNNDNK